MSTRIKSNLLYGLIVFAIGTAVTGGNWFVGLVASAILTEANDITHFKREREKEAKKDNSTWI